MSRLVLHSFAELATVLNLGQASPSAHTGGDTQTCETDLPAAEAIDLDTLLDHLQLASAVLAEAERQDADARAIAQAQLDAYDAIVARTRAAQDARNQAAALRDQAVQVAEHGFEETVRVAARRARDLAAHTADMATVLVTQLQAERDGLSTFSAVQWLLKERRREVEAAHEQAAEAERTRRLVAGITAVRAVLAAGNLQEAEAMLGHLTKEHPNSADVTSLQVIIRHRTLAVKSAAAQAALRTARRLARRQPADAVARLESLDLNGLPEPLLRQIIGVWTALCARLCHERGLTGYLRYGAARGHGIVIIRERDDAPYTVLSALGGHTACVAGHTVDEPFVQMARPLRMGRAA